MMEELEFLKDAFGQWRIIDKNTGDILWKGSIEDLIDPIDLDKIAIEGKIMREGLRPWP